MTAILNLSIKHLPPILSHTPTASRTSAILLEPLLEACDFLFGPWKVLWVIWMIRRKKVKWKSRSTSFPGSLLFPYQGAERETGRGETLGTRLSPVVSIVKPSGPSVVPYLSVGFLRIVRFDLTTPSWFVKGSAIA